jgi:TolB-like protein
MSTIEASNTIGLFSAEQIHMQIQRIFLCPAFSVSDILRRFLSYIVDETLYGRSNTIKEYTIAVNVLNKPPSFKPQHDAIVRIHAGRLRRALNYYYKEQGIGDEIEITVPKGTYVPVFGNMQIAETKPDAEETPELQKDSNDSVTIAILPFKTFEKDKSKLSFADSLGQQLSAEFGKFPDFSVIAYYTTQQLSTKNKGIHELASDYGAQYIVTGNVHFESKRLRVAVQLTETHNGAQVWTELYSRNYSSSNLFELEDDIITNIIAALGDFNGLIIQQLSKSLYKNKFGRSPLPVLSWYHEFYSTFNKASFKKAYLAMELAVEENPANENAWSFLGQLALLSFLFSHSTRGNPFMLGLKCAHNALKINPLSQNAHYTLGMANIFLNNKQAAMDSLEYSLALNPNATGLIGIIGCLMICAGEYNRGIELIRESIDRNKSYPPFFNLFVSLYHFKLKEYSQAYRQVEKSGISELVLNAILRVSILVNMGRKSEAYEMMKVFKGFQINKTWISREQISRFLLDQDLVDNLYKGLKAINVPVLTVA